MASDDSGEMRAAAPAGETELKFDVTPEQLRRLAKHPLLAGEGVAESFKATYFDTPGFALRKAGYSLRVRKEGTRFVQTAKRMRGQDMFRRDEWEGKVRSGRLDQRALAATPIPKLLKGETGKLAPVFVSEVTRTTRVWNEKNTEVVVTVDEGRLKAGAAQTPVLELELELKFGSPYALYRLARNLFDAAPIRLSLRTKSDRGFALAGVENANGKRSATPLSPAMSIAESFRRIARACLVQVVSNAEVLQREPSAEGVHQTRVGLRRLRTAMKIFKPAVDDAHADWIEQEARWVAGELGDARTLDVFTAEHYQPLAPHLTDADATAKYSAQLATARMAAYDKALAAVSSPRFARLALEIAVWLDGGDWRRAQERRALLESPIGPFAADALERLRKTVRDKGENLEGLDRERRHKLRIRAKRLRYATQFFERAFEGGEHRRRRFGEALKSLQESLGRLNDIAAAEDAAKRAVEGVEAAALAFAAGEVVGRIKVTEPVEVEKAIQAFGDFTEAKRYWPKSKRPPREEPEAKPDA